MENKTLDLYMKEIRTEISHLDKKSIIEMIIKYYDGVSITKLKNEYNISIVNSQFFTIFPEKIMPDKCEYCGYYMVQEWKSKSSYNLYTTKPYCKKCGHENLANCECNTCEMIRSEELIRQRERKSNLIKKVYEKDKFTSISENDLTLEDKLYLSVLIRAALDENIGKLKPLSSINEKLTPTGSFTKELIKTLTGRRLIVPDSTSSVDAFVDNEDFPYSYYINDVLYWLNITSADNNYRNMIQRLMYPSQEEFEKDKEFCFTMWRKVALNECIEYLLYSLDKVGFEFSPGEKTNKVFENLLDYFSVSQIYSIIYRAVANSTKFYQEKAISKQRAANSVITSCESFGERAIAEGWRLSKYRRDYNLPETLISKVFFTSILKIAFMGFDEVPTENL